MLWSALYHIAQRASRGLPLHWLIFLKTAALWRGLERIAAADSLGYPVVRGQLFGVMSALALFDLCAPPLRPNSKWHKELPSYFSPDVLY